MKVASHINEIREIVGAWKLSGKSVGLVPTMGYLHEGHLSLARASVKDNDHTVMSIFVNPTQFGPTEDLERYPRDMEGDVGKAASAGVDIIFAPDAAEMYPAGYSTYVEVNGITDKMCGKSRPGHFKGVTTIVTKLFNIVQPSRAYFGQKDAQQAAVVRKMARELNMPVEIVICPIVREPDGLAMSSRNVYLSPEERTAALILSKSLFKAEDMIKTGLSNIEGVKDYLEESIKGEKLADIDYIEIVDADSFDRLDMLKGRVLAALAVRIGKTRLIDNIIVDVLRQD